MENYIPMETEFCSLDHGLYKLIEVWMIYRKNSKYSLLWHNVTVNKSHIITRPDIIYIYMLRMVMSNLQTYK